jgi:transposase
MMSLKDAASLAGVGWDTVKRIFKSDMAKEVGRINLKEVELLAIDEVYLGRLHKFITLVIDWQSGRVLYVAKGRGEDALRPFFRRFRLAKARIKAVATDLSAAYAASVIKHLPGALLAADRFHIIKLMNEKIDELRRSLQRETTIMGRTAIKRHPLPSLAGTGKPAS